MAELIPDGTTDFSGGQNAAVKAFQIGPNQYYTGINVSTVNGVLQPRWALRQKKLDWSEAGSYRKLTGALVPFENVFKSGKFQGFIPYSIGNDNFAIYIVSGFIFLINKASLLVKVLNPVDPLDPYKDRVNWSNAGIYLVIYDWPNAPFILEGIITRRSNPSANEVPVSVLGAYNQNRLCIANYGISWTAGDPAGSTATPDAPITFTEVNQSGSPYVGDIYECPTANRNNDRITAMGFLQVLDKSTEIGPLLVATDKAIYSYRTDLPRKFWQGGTDGAVFGSVLLYNAGIVAQRAFCNVNSDIIFKSADGQVRALSMARNAQKLWANFPISKEVQKFLDATDITLGKFSTCSYFGNKVFITCNPYRVDAYTADGILQTDYVCGGAVVLEADNISCLSNPDVAPVWAGLWTGVRFMDFCEVEGTLMVAGKLGNENGLYEWVPEQTFDEIDGRVRLIRSVVETREYACSDPTKTKQIHHLEMGIEELEEDVTVDISYKPGTMKQFFPWRTLCFNAPVAQCEAEPEFPQGLSRQGILNLNVGGVSQDDCNAADMTPTYMFKRVQLRLIITGKHWELSFLKLLATVHSESQVDVYQKKKAVKIPAQCFDAWYIPELNDC